MLSYQKIKEAAEASGLSIGENLSGVALVVHKDGEMHCHITLGELSTFARTIYEQGRADQRESDANVAERTLRHYTGAVTGVAEAIRSNNGDINES